MSCVHLLCSLPPRGHSGEPYPCNAATHLRVLSTKEMRRRLRRRPASLPTHPPCSGPFQPARQTRGHIRPLVDGLDQNRTVRRTRLLMPREFGFGSLRFARDTALHGHPSSTVTFSAYCPV